MTKQTTIVVTGSLRVKCILIIHVGGFIFYLKCSSNFEKPKHTVHYLDQIRYLHSLSCKHSVLALRDIWESETPKNCPGTSKNQWQEVWDAQLLKIFSHL